jgi:hypothetical protein
MPWRCHAELQMELLTNTISIRTATPDDAQAVTQLALLDSAEPPAAPLLLAERDGRLQAALSLSDGTTIGDPFAPTAELIALLHVRAERLRGGTPFLTRVQGAIYSRRRRRAYAA